MTKPWGKTTNRCRVMRSRTFQTFDKITMRVLSCAYNRSRAIGKEKKLVAQFAGLRDTRESLDRGKAVRVTFNERKTLVHLLLFFLSLSLCPSFLVFFRDGLLPAWPVPFAFFGRSSRKQIAAVSFSHLAASIPLLRLPYARKS